MLAPRLTLRLAPFFQNHPNWPRHGTRLALGLRVSATLLVLLAAFVLGFFPAVTTARVALSSSLRQRGQVAELGTWFRETGRRYDRWAAGYRANHYAAAVHSEDVAATEWPLFGSVFYLLSAEELLKTRQITLDDELLASLKGAAKVVADPVSATWVQKKWGPAYLESENVFYRMLVMLGLHSYDKMTDDHQFASLVEQQGIGAARAAGRFDHAAPLTMLAIAAAWPTPFGLLVPGFMGWVAADSWCLGETSFHFAMTRPNYRGQPTPFMGRAPLVVWGFVLFYAALGVGLTLREWHYWRRYYSVDS